MNLRTYLATPPASQTCVLAPSGEWSTGRLLAYNAECFGWIQGQRVAIQLADVGNGLQALTAFDGLAESVTLLPASLQSRYLGNLLENAGCDLLLTDRTDLPSGLPVSAIYGQLIEMAGAQTISPDRATTTEWHLVTSGTTGPPKLVSHTLASIIRTTKLLPNGKTRPCWGLLYDYTRFAGLQVLLQAVLPGAQLVAPETGASLSEKITQLVKAGCSHLSATPTVWRTIVMTPGSEVLPLHQVTLGGEIVDDRLLGALSEMFPDARVTHIYAATEAGVGFAVHDRQCGFPSSFLTTPPAGVCLRVEGGRLYLKNTGVKPTYVGTHLSFGSDDGWIDTGDNVERIGDRIYFQGRANGLLNVGGNKVHPEEVERLLREHPAVSLARVYGRPSSIVGTIMQADVVLTEQHGDRQAACREIKAFIRSRVDAEKVPAIIRIVNQLDVTPAGKLRRGAA